MTFPPPCPRESSLSEINVSVYQMLFQGQTLADKQWAGALSVVLLGALRPPLLLTFSPIHTGTE